jgi:hypothetical protein
VTQPFRVFRRSNLLTECEECRLPVDLSRAGACIRCRRVLCHGHLHGSFLRRLVVDMALAPPVCLTCRIRPE